MRASVRGVPSWLLRLPSVAWVGLEPAAANLGDHQPVLTIHQLGDLRAALALVQQRLVARPLARQDLPAGIDQALDPGGLPTLVLRLDVQHLSLV